MFCLIVFFPSPCRRTIANLLVGHFLPFTEGQGCRKFVVRSFSSLSLTDGRTDRRTYARNDGRTDGGTDVRMFNQGQNKSQLEFQLNGGLTVEMRQHGIVDIDLLLKRNDSEADMLRLAVG